MAAQCMGMRHSSAMHGNTTRQCNVQQHDTAVQCSSATHGNATQQHTNNAIYGTAPNKDATASNDTPGITHPPRQPCKRAVKAALFAWTLLLMPTNTDATPPPPDPAYQHPNNGVLGGPAQTAVHEPEYGPSTPHPLQRVWGTTSTGPQYPAPTAAGVGYCKILNQNPHKPPTTNPPNNMPQTKTMNKAP
ncbi:hypothetical protein BS47DRAFT_1366332 [Hydnum rufescens UP504]|uniref:Uncharacterized protein n=1 Tax=Hydnum rufescens UP504 TaxID=1448309 RepID=A0A9P6AL32_9AGAM|nr:hypothetical protein BS47DRAFT_1366332 [Hydnum rufescens UP504]